ncbi:MAG: RNA polymerase sigma factor [Bacteroidota bacterium]
MNEDKQLEQRLRQDDKQALETVYLKYKDAFIAYVRKHQLGTSDALDLYQDAIIAMHQQFVSKQVVLQRSNLKTYLFGIGKNLLLKQLEDKKRPRPASMPPEREEPLPLDESPLTEEQRLLLKHFGSLSKSCQDMLKLFYYRGLSIKEIVALTNYKDENTVKSHKSRCLKRLTEFIAKK